MDENVNKNGGFHQAAKQIHKRQNEFNFNLKIKIKIENFPPVDTKLSLK